MGIPGAPGGADGAALLNGGAGLGPPSAGSKRGKSGRREHLKRLPADIRAQVQVLQVQAVPPTPHSDADVPFKERDRSLKNLVCLPQVDIYRISLLRKCQ